MLQWDGRASKTSKGGCGRVLKTNIASLLYIYSGLISSIFEYLPTPNYLKHPMFCNPCPAGPDAVSLARYNDHQHYHLWLYGHHHFWYYHSSSNYMNVSFPNRDATAEESNISRCDQNFVWFQDKRKTQWYLICMKYFANWISFDIAVKILRIWKSSFVETPQHSAGTSTKLIL